MDKIPFTQTRFYFGGDYNPEQWPESTWQEDVALMKTAGVNLVTLGVFSWAKLESQPGVYDFDWMDRIIQLLHEKGISLCLATATASPPPWLAKLHPESLPTDADGITYFPGGRQAYCPHSTDYRQAAAALVKKMAERYGRHPALKIWHINNEYGCHTDECFCSNSSASFRKWLKDRYGTIDKLNHAWATSFWSQQYWDWDEIHPPRRAPTFSNPTQNLDWRRFSSDSLLELMEMERDILHSITPAVPVTTNFLGFWKTSDYWKWSKQEDVISMDAYPDPSEPLIGGSVLAMQSDMMRSLGEGRPWMLMEQAPGAVNWRPQNVPKPPGLMRLWSLQTVVRGAGAVMFFQWRASRAGAEKFHSGMIQHVGTQNSRVWKEVIQLGNELTAIDTLLPAKLHAEVAILFDWESWWGLELDSKPSMDVKLTDQLACHYEVLFRSNIPVDFAHPGDDLSRYKVVIIPNLYQVRAADAENITRYVENGGRVFMSFFSGIVDENEHVWLGGYPAPFRQLLGIMIEEFVPAAKGQTGTVKWSDGSFSSCDLWAEIIHLEGAEALAVFNQDYYTGRPAITRHRFGKGSACYLGTRLDVQGLQRAITLVLHEAGIQPVLKVPAGVEVVLRQSTDRTFLCVLNHLPEAMAIPLDHFQGRDLLTGQHCHGQVVLQPSGVLILDVSR